MWIRRSKGRLAKGEAHIEVKMLKTLQLESTFGSGEVQKVTERVGERERYRDSERLRDTQRDSERLRASTTFRSISGFALPSMHRKNSPLL